MTVPCAHQCLGTRDSFWHKIYISSKFKIVSSSLTRVEKLVFISSNVHKLPKTKICPVFRISWKKSECWWWQQGPDYPAAHVSLPHNYATVHSMTGCHQLICLETPTGGASTVGCDLWALSLLCWAGVSLNELQRHTSHDGNTFTSTHSSF